MVARPRRQLTAIQLDDPRREALQKRAVVGDEEDRAGILGEKVLEPRNRVDVEVVGRLVEQQDVGLSDERARQEYAAAPPARQRIDDDLGIEVKARQHQVDVMLAPPGLVFVEMVRVPFGHHVEHGSLGGERHVLLEARDAQRRLAPDGAGVGRDLAADDFQQRRLAGTVPADERDAFSRLHLQRHAVEQGQMAVRDRHAVHRDERHPANVPRARFVVTPAAGGSSACRSR